MGELANERRLPRPTPTLTPLQRSCCHLGEAIRVARMDARAWTTFLSIASIWIAHEYRSDVERDAS
jgi:hypothetical protein